MGAGLRTTAEEVVAHFASKGQAMGKLRWWQGLEGRGHVVDAVMNHVTSAVYTLRSSEIRRLTTEHAIGEVRPEAGYAVHAIKNWRPDFAFNHLFHFCLEAYESPFSYQEFRDYCRREPAKGWFTRPAWEKIREVQKRGVSTAAASSSMRWRVGLAYYSFLRELYMIARLREADLDVRSHPLADSLFLADAWSGNTVVELYISNNEFKGNSRGRKNTASDLLGDQAKFRFIRLEMARQYRWGQVHLPSDGDISRCASDIRSASRAT